jgi:hypothetical protein
MKYFVPIILLLIVFFVLLISGNESTFIVSVFIVPLVFLILFFWEYSDFKINFQSDFKIRSQKKTPKLYDLIFGICWSVFAVIGSLETRFKILYIIMVWAPFIISIIMFFLYRNKKPYTIYISNDELLTIVDRWTQKRDIVGLNQIQFDRINKNIKFSFDEGYQISTQTKDYKKEDIDELLDIVIKKSKHPIFIPNNYKAEKLIKES